MSPGVLVSFASDGWLKSMLRGEAAFHHGQRSAVDAFLSLKLGKFKVLIVSVLIEVCVCRKRRLLLGLQHRETTCRV